MTDVSIIRKNGAVYTPQGLSHYLAQKTLQYALDDPDISRKKKLSIIDPASGDGILLGAIESLLYEKISLNNLILCGIDFDSEGISASKKKLYSIRDTTKLILINTNSLIPFGLQKVEIGWNVLFEKAKVEDGFDILIANPPWGADISSYKDKLDSEFFSTLRGQVDSFELFLELATHIVRPSGYFSFIIPDSIFNHGKESIRSILLGLTEIRFIARLGEKIFPGINRACVIIVCKNLPPSNNNMVKCFRLLPKDRTKILTGEITFSEAESIRAHIVPQTRFSSSPYNQFSIDLRESESDVLDKLGREFRTLGDVLTSTRGVELGSSGAVSRCHSCGKWSPLTKRKVAECSYCGTNYNPQTSKNNRIVSDEQLPNSVPLITGSDIRRYRCTPSKWIQLDKDGINYKLKEIYSPPKILIRKTGVGLTAALDYTHAYTNQVVYIIKRKDESIPSLEFFIALVNSRAYYFYLVKSFGEMEWKSHPYLTQSQILSLPLPDIESEGSKSIINRIISILKPNLKTEPPSKQEDIEIELLIGRLFSLTMNDYEVIFNTIDEAEELLPIRELKKLTLENLHEKSEWAKSWDTDTSVQRQKS